MTRKIFELRNYQLKSGVFDEFLAHFERRLVEPQEAVGMSCIGQFHCAERPDRFIWLRGFPDMESRLEGLNAFYGGPDWAEHKGPANDLMTEWHDVHLLTPLAGLELPLHALRGVGPHALPYHDSWEFILVEAPRETHAALATEVADDALGHCLGMFGPVDQRNDFDALPVWDAPERMLFVIGDPDDAINRQCADVLADHGGSIHDRMRVTPSTFSRKRWAAD